LTIYAILQQEYLVKMLDDNFPDHIGWLLWQASDRWHRDFVTRMQSAGHAWFTEARSSLIGSIAPKGTRQGLLVERLAISKQAVQQLLDGLEAEGITERIADPDDKRGKIVRLTPMGKTAMRDAARIKSEIEAEYQLRIGADAFAHLSDLLRKLRDG
jgi:DNA-binding MarR family transcriptional regulator